MVSTHRSTAVYQWAMLCLVAVPSDWAHCLSRPIVDSNNIAKDNTAVQSAGVVNFTPCLRVLGILLDLGHKSKNDLLVILIP